MVRLVKDSYDRIESASIDYIEVFYDHLFKDSPPTRRLFIGRGTPTQKLKATIKIVVASLDQLEELQGMIVNLGKRHIHYGVEPEDFSDVQDALLKAFKITLPDFSDQEEKAWHEAISQVIAVMIRAWD